MPAARKPSTRRRRPVQARAQETVAAILEAAARLYERGSTTTNRIAQLAGVSIGSLYEYFPNKDAIIHALLDKHMRAATEQLLAELAALDPETTPLELGIRRLVDLMLDLHADRPGLHRLFVARVMGLPAVRQRLNGIELELRREVTAWLRSHPEVSVTDAALAARVVVQSTDALVHRYVEDDEGVSPEDFAAALTGLWMAYLSDA
jgi:AcrR family transcriptional regulator